MEVTQKKFRTELHHLKFANWKVFQKEEIIPSYQHAPMENGSYWADVLIYGVHIYAYLQIYNLTLCVLYPMVTNLKP